MANNGNGDGSGAFAGASADASGSASLFNERSAYWTASNPRSGAMPMAFELGSVIGGGAFSPLRTHVLVINPETYSRSDASGDSVQHTRRGPIPIRDGWVSRKYQMSGHTRGVIGRSEDGGWITGESVMRSLESLFLMFVGHPDFLARGADAGDGTDSKRVIIGETVHALEDLRLRFYNFDEPTSLESPASPFYDILPDPGNVFRMQRNAKNVLFRYSLSFSAYGWVNSVDNEDAFFDAVTSREAAYAEAYEGLLSDANWSFLVDLGEGLATFAADTARYRNMAKDAMADGAWREGGQAGFARSDAEAAMAAFDEFREGW